MAIGLVGRQFQTSPPLSVRVGVGGGTKVTKHVVAIVLLLFK